MKSLDSSSSGGLDSDVFGVGKDEKMVSAAALFLPTMTILELPFVWEANARAIASPIPDVPPTKTATGAGEVRWLKAALVARIDASDGIE